MKSAIHALSICLISALSVSGQASKPFDIYVGGGISLASSPSWFKDLWKDGSHISGGFGFKALPTIQIVAKAQYHSFPYDYDRKDAGGVIGFSQRFYMLGIDGRFAPKVPGVRVTPFAFAGIGVAKLTAKGTRAGWRRVTTPIEETRMYTNIGGGIEYRVAPILTFFVQGNYVSISTTRGDIAFIPITVGLRF